MTRVGPSESFLINVCILFLLMGYSGLKIPEVQKIRMDTDLTFAILFNYLCRDLPRLQGSTIKNFHILNRNIKGSLFHGKI